MTRQSITAADLRPGDFVPALDNGYVFDIEDDADIRNGDYNTRFAEGLRLVSLHDRNGEEFYLFLPEDLPLDVDREE